MDQACVKVMGNQSSSGGRRRAASVREEDEKPNKEPELMDAFFFLRKEGHERAKLENRATHSCDVCRRVIEEKHRFHCSECTNFDVCAACFASSEFRHKHDALAFAREVTTPQRVMDMYEFEDGVKGNLSSMLNLACESFEDRRCFGVRSRSGDAVWIKYRTVKNKIYDTARALTEYRRLLCKNGQAEAVQVWDI